MWSTAVSPGLFLPSPVPEGQDEVTLHDGLQGVDGGARGNCVFIPSVEQMLMCSPPLAGAHTSRWTGQLPCATDTAWCPGGPLSLEEEECSLSYWSVDTQ